MENYHNQHERSVLKKLRLSWLAYGLLAYAYLAFGWAALQLFWNADYALRWFLQASLVVVYMLIVLGRHLDQNRLDFNSSLLPTLGWGNRMTLLRGLFIASLAGFILLPWPNGWLAWLPGILYCLVAIADILDGYLARRTHQVTMLGATLDMSLDSLGVLFAAILLVQYGQVPPFYIFVGLARYLFLSGAWVAKRLGRPLSELPLRRHRLIFASLQFAFIGIVLFPVFFPPLTWWAAIFFSLPFLINFFIDFLFVITIIKPSPVSRVKIPVWLGPSFQVFLRLLLPIIGLILLWQIISQSTQPDIGVQVLQTIFLIANGLILVGFAGRISSGVALILVGLSQQITPVTVIQIILVAGYIALIYLGTGPRSIWSPEEIWYGLRMRASKNLHSQPS